MSANGGGPAFPSGEKYHTTDLAGRTRDHAKAPFYAGLSLRDYFAAHAPITLADAVEQCGWSCIEKRYFSDAERDTLFRIMALMRAEYADAMLAERAK